MSTEALNEIREVIEEAKMHATYHRVILDQLTISMNALMLISHGEPGAQAIAQDALNRVIAKIPKLVG